MDPHPADTSLPGTVLNRIGRRLFFTVGVNTVVALFLALPGRDSLWVNWVYSQCIGLLIWACIDGGRFVFHPHGQLTIPAEMSLNILGKLPATKQVLAAVDDQAIAQHMQRGQMGAYINQCHGSPLQTRQQCDGPLPRMGFDIHHSGHQPGQIEYRLQHFDTLPATGGQQHIDSPGIVRAGADYMKIERHIIQGIRDVLVGIDSQLNFQLIGRQAGGHVQHSGDDRRSGNRHGDMPGAGMSLGHQP